VAGLQAARARGRQGGRTFGLTKTQVCLAQAAMKNRDATVRELCRELGGMARATLSRYVSPTGERRDHGKRVLARCPSRTGPPASMSSRVRKSRDVLPVLSPTIPIAAA
jgi:hypothetical protein